MAHKTQIPSPYGKTQDLRAILGWMAAAAILLGSMSGHADVVSLKNGGKLEGVITAQDKEKLTIDLGFGSMDVQRGEISRVVRSSSSENTKIRSHWNSEYFDHLRFVPPGCEPLAAELRKLFSLRAEALSEARRVKESADRAEHLRNEMKNAEQADRKATAQLRDADSRAAPGEYNRLVTEVNRVRSQISLLRNELEGLDSLRTGGLPAMSSYAIGLTAFSKELRAQNRKTKDGSKASAERETFNIRAKEIWGKLNEDFQQTEIKVPSTGNRHLVLPVTINAKTTGRFLLDTGASELTMSLWFASRLGLDLSAADAVIVSLADGRKVKAKRIKLALVALGNAKAQNVSAVVLDDPPGPGLDGLLGMSFLGRFFIELDAASGKLVLRSFEGR